MSLRFYVNLPLCSGLFTLDGAEAHHVATVCRLQPGNEVCLFNGNGHEYPARIIHIARHEITVEILDEKQPELELPYPLEVASPLPKGDRSQFLIEKLTELGVMKLIPLSCERSNQYPRDFKKVKLERQVIEASKQCGRNVLMEIADLTTWPKYLEKTQSGEIRILAHPYEMGDQVDLPVILKQHSKSNAICIAIGPEGGFIQEEIDLARQAHWQILSLGPRILRIETAAIALAAQVQGWLTQKARKIHD